MRQIDWTKPLSEEDAKWVNSFGNRAMRRKLADNLARNASVEEVVSDEEEEDPVPSETDDSYDDMTVDQLKEEAKGREGFNFKGIRNRPQLITALREYDSASQ